MRGTFPWQTRFQPCMTARLIVSAYRGRAKLYLEANGYGSFDEGHDVRAADEQAQDDETADKLARCVCGYVRQARVAQMFDELIVIAPQKLLDRLGNEIG